MSNADLRAGSPAAFDDPDGVAAISKAKRSALLSNPLLGPDDEPVQLLAVDGARVLGRLDLLAAEIVSPAGPVPCFFGSGFHVAESARGRGLGTMLLRGQDELRPISAVCGPSRLALPLYGKLGYLDVAMPRYLLVRRSGPLLERWLGRGPANRAAAVLADGVAAAHREALGLARRALARGLTSEAVDSFPPGVDPSAAHERDFAAHRSARWLDWVVHESFLDSGHRRGLYLVRDRDGVVVAYFLTKARVYSDVTEWALGTLDLGSLIDWRILEPRAVRFEHLVLFAVEALDEWGVGAIEVCVPPDEMPARLRRLGLVRLRAQRFMVRGNREDARLREINDPSRWLIRPGDGDYAFS